MQQCVHSIVCKIVFGLGCRTTKKGYEEVHVPALKPKPFAENEKLVGIKDLPDWAQPAFGGMQSLNRVQSRVSDCALYSSENMLVCAPTGKQAGHHWDLKQHRPAANSVL